MHLAGNSIKNSSPIITGFQWLSFMPSFENCQVYNIPVHGSFVPSDPLSHRVLDRALLQLLPIHFIFIFNLLSVFVHQPHPGNEEGSATHTCFEQETEKHHHWKMDSIQLFSIPIIFQSSHWKPFETNPNYQRNLKHSHFFAATHQSAFLHGRLRPEISN